MTDRIDERNMLDEIAKNGNISVISCDGLHMVVSDQPVAFPLTGMECHNFYEIFIPLSPNWMLIIDQVKISAHLGQIIAANPGQKHGRDRDTAPVAFILLLYEPACLAGLFQYVNAGEPVFLTNRAYVMTWDMKLAVAQLLREHRQCDIGYNQMISAQAKLLAIRMVRLIGREEQARELADKHRDLDFREKMQGVHEFMEKNLGIIMTVNQLADRVQMKGSRFILIYKKVYGISPHQQLIRMRVQYAKRLLFDRTLTNQAISQICGFGSASRFAASFRRETGLTPTRYRQINQPETGKGGGHAPAAYS